MQLDTVFRVNQMIAALYAGGDLTERLKRFYHDLYDMIYYDRVSIMFYKTTEAGWEKQSSISLNWDDIKMTMDHYKEYFINIDDTMPILAQENPIVFRSSQIFDNEKRRSTEYFQGFQVPAGCINSIEANIDMQSNIGLKANFYVFRDSDKADFTEEDETLIRIFQPHLSRILRHHGERVCEEQIASVFSSSCAALLVLDSRFNIVEHSTAYTEMRDRYGSRLDESIINCCFAMKKIGSASSEDDHYMTRLKDMPYFVEVTKQPEKGNSTGRKYVCMIFDISAMYRCTQDMIRDWYSLTEREYVVFRELLKGLDTKEMATELYISIPAVKKYCSSIYGKLGISSRNQIINTLELE